MRPRIWALLACAVALAPAWAGGGPRVAILPVVVHSAAPDPSYLSDGLADMLGARLEQLGGMRVVRDDDERSATTRLPQALERARALEADYVVFGSFTQFGDGASLDVQCAPVRADDPAAARTLFVQSGAIGEIIPKLDDLADKVAYFVLGDDQGRSAVEDRTRRAAPIRDLVGRVEALERSVFGKASAAPAPAPAPAPEAEPSGEVPGPEPAPKPAQDVPEQPAGP